MPRNTHCLRGLMDRCSERKTTLTSSATSTRACSKSSPISRTQPRARVRGFVSGRPALQNPKEGQ
eukprot:1106213-Prymnesium_polylepis.1